MGCTVNMCQVVFLWGCNVTVLVAIV